jgi:uncharacterized protein involved in outer membrane biogenesis
MKRAGIALAVLVALAFAAALALPYLLDVNHYRDQIQAELQARTGRTVSLGRMELKIFPLAFRAENAVIGEDPAFASGPPFLQVPELLVAAQHWPLLRGEIRVDALVLRRPKIELIKNAHGQWNFATLGHATSKAPTGAAPAPQAGTAPAAPEAPEQRYALADLQVTDGQVAITDQAARAPRAVYDHIDLRLTGYAPGRAVRLELAAHLPGEGRQTLRLKGRGGPVAAEPVNTPFEGRVELEEVSYSGLQRFLNATPAGAFEVTASGSAEIRSHEGDLQGKGKLEFTKTRVRGVNIEYPITTEFALRVRGDKVEIERGAMRLGQTPVGVSGTIDTAPQPMRMSMKAKADNVSIAEMARLAGAFGVAFQPGLDVQGRTDLDLSMEGPATGLVYRGRVSLRELTATGAQLPQPVKIPTLQLVLTQQEIRSEEFSATSGSTKVTAQFLLSGYGTSSPVLDAKLTAPDAQLGELISIGRTYGGSVLDGIGGTGAVALDVRMRGPTRNPAAMNYSGSGRLRGASLTLPAFLKPLQIRSADLEFSRNAVSLKDLAFTLGSSNASGRITLHGLAPGADPTAEFSLAADRWDLNEFVSMLRPKGAASAGAGSLAPELTAQAAEPQPDPFLMRLKGTGDLQAASLIVNQLQMTQAKSGATIEGGVLKLAPFSAQLYGGTQQGAILFDFRGEHTAYQVNTKLDKVDTNQLLSSVTNIKQTLYGLLAGAAAASFRGPAAEMTRSINGTIALHIQDGKLVGLDLLQELAKIGKFFGMKESEKKVTNLVKLTGEFKIRDGVATTDNLNATLDTGTITARGSVDLNSQALDLQMVAVLDKEFSQSVGGTQVGGYLTTALANQKGELVMPVTVTGPMNAPKVAPDYKALARMKVENLFPVGGKGGVLDAVFGKKEPTPDAQGGSEKKSAGTLQTVLDALGGKKSQPPSQPQAQPAPGGDAIPDPTATPKAKEKAPAKEEDKIPDPSNPK